MKLDASMCTSNLKSQHGVIKIGAFMYWFLIVSFTSWLVSTNFYKASILEFFATKFVVENLYSEFYRKNTKALIIHNYNL